MVGLKKESILRFTESNVLRLQLQPPDIFRGINSNAIQAFWPGDTVLFDKPSNVSAITAVLCNQMDGEVKVEMLWI